MPGAPKWAPVRSSMAGSKRNDRERPMATDNPYASPLADIESHLPARLTASQMLGLISIGLLGGAVLGMFTNSINGAASPQYFRDVMGWDGPDIWGSAVRQGALEGSIYGAFFATVLTAIIAVVSGRRCSFRTALRYEGCGFAATIACWLLGGAFSVAYALVVPGACGQFGWQCLGYAWVGGSIVAGVNGGLLATILCGGLYARRHHPQKRRAAAADVSE